MPRGIEVHAWFVNGAYGDGGHKGILDERPEWRMMDLSGRRIDWYDLCQPEVRAWQTRLMIDCLRRYTIDGLHFDYIRFQGGRSECVCPSCTEAIKRDTGLDLADLRYPELPALGFFEANPLEEPTTASVLARFDHGMPAIAVNELGRGKVVLFNWKVYAWCPQAATTADRRLLEAAGLKPGADVLVLDSATHKDERWRYYRYGADWVQGPRRVTDEDLSRLRPGTIVVMAGFYDMPDDAAKHLAAHVEGGGTAVFLDGPVFAVHRLESARRLLGFARPDRYLRGLKQLLPAGGAERLVPSSGRPLDIAVEQAKWATWDQWRRDQVTALVRQVREEARKVRPDALVTAAVFRGEADAQNVFQDWPRWHRERLCDYLVPMSYFRTPEELQGNFEWWKQMDPPLERTVPAVGAFRIAPEASGEPRAAEIGRQVEVCRRQGAKGVVMFLLKAIDDDTAKALGRTVFPGKASPYRPPPG